MAKHRNTNVFKKLQIGKFLNLLVLISLVISSCGVQSPGENQKENKSKSGTRIAEWVHFQPPIFAQPEPRKGQRPPISADADTESRLPVTYKSSLQFIENVGQFDERAMFQSRAGNQTLFVTRDALWLTIIEETTQDVSTGNPQTVQDEFPTDPALSLFEAGKIIKGINLRLTFVGANDQTHISGISPITANISYLNSDNSPKDDVPGWDGLNFQSIYPGYDLALTGTNGAFSWELVENSPEKSTLKELRLRVEGGQSVVLHENGVLVKTEIGNILLPLPQFGEKGMATNAYVDGDDIVLQLTTNASDPIQGTMHLASWQPSPLFNESTEYITILHGSEGDSAADIAVDAIGQAYVVGYTTSPDFPTTPGAFNTIPSSGIYQVFVSKFDEVGTLAYSTIIGPGRGSAIAVDSAGVAYLTGVAYDDFPTTPGAFDTTYEQFDFGNAFLTKVNAGGDQLIYSTYLGRNADDGGSGIALDADGGAYIIGSTYDYTGEFPVTGGAYDTTFNGSLTAFVSYFNASGQLAYSTFFGTEDDPNAEEWGEDIAVDENGNVYVVGRTDAPSPLAGPIGFPTTAGAYDTTYNGGWSDGFVAKFNPSLSQLLYSTFLGGSAISGFYESVHGIALDSESNIYVVGDTTSSDFPITADAIDNQISSSDAFVSIISADGSQLLYSSFLGGLSTEAGSIISLDADGNFYVTGSTHSVDFPVTPWAFDTSKNARADAFLTKFAAGGSSLVYSTFFGASDEDTSEHGSGIALDADGSAFIAGSITTYPAINSDVLVAKFGIYGTTVHTASVLSGCNIADECIQAAQGNSQGIKFGPINTRTGGLFYQTEDMSVPTAAKELSFFRSYSSLATDLYSSALGFGWTHNLDLHLIFSDDPGGEQGYILFKAHTANQYRFADVGNGIFVPTPGVVGNLVFDDNEYVLTYPDQSVYVFDADGKLQTWSDSIGNTWQYTYNTSGLLERVSADGGARYLKITYDNGRIEVIEDHAERSISFDYDDETGDLISMTDVMGEIWQYEYEDHLLTRVKDPLGHTIERTEYEDGRAVRQYNAFDTLIGELTYNTDGTTTITDALEKVETHTYDNRLTLRGDEDGAGGTFSKEYNENFRPKTITDANTNVTELIWSADGANLNYIKDAAGDETFISYNSSNQPEIIIDPLEYETKYFYADTNFPTLPTRIEYPLSFDGGATYIGTDYEYYPPSSGASVGKVKFVTDALGNQTFYTYTSFGQTESITSGYGTDGALTTSYEYDPLGRLTKTTDPNDVVTLNEYDAAGQLLKTTHNFVDSRPQNDENKYNIVTEFRYDERNNQIAVIDTYRTITRTYYDAANRPVTLVQNLVIGAPATSDAEVTAAVNTPLANVPAYDAAHSDWNIRNDTEYDNAGNVIVTRDTAGVITRTYYDDANRPKLVIQNWSGTDLYGSILDAPSYDPAFPDLNVRTENFYDDNSNLIAIKDTLGIITRTYYDELNRPKSVVQHLTGQDITIPAAPDRGTSSNIRTDTHYDANGNVIATVDPKNVTTRTYYDSLNRPIAVVQNLTGKSYTDQTLPDPGEDCGTEANICSFTYYDEAGNVIATVDPTGLVTRTYYDEASRPSTIVQNLIGDIYANPPARGDGSTDQNVRTDIAYDTDGRRDTIKDPMGRDTKYEYNELGQLVKVTANYLNGGEPKNDENQRNIVTEYAYDALGRQTTITDTLDRITRTEYDNLGRVLTTTQNYLSGEVQNYKDPVTQDQFNLVTTYTYDVSGNQIAVTDTQDVVTRTYYDALGRPVTVVRNLFGYDISSLYPPERLDPPSPSANVRTDTIYLGTGVVDYVLDEMGEKTDYEYDNLGRLTTVVDPLLHPTSYQYDANGNRTFMTDAEDVSTKFTYDGLNRLQIVEENYLVGVNADDETNVRTEYTYDAAGNRLSILDGEQHSTLFTYTALGQLETETDAAGLTNSHGYNAIGNRTSLRDPNHQATNEDIIYVYDEMNRLEKINYPTSDDIDVTFTYDALGRRLSMTDETGTTLWDYTNIDLPYLITDPFGTGISYEYDPLGNRTVLSYNDQVVNYDYNNLNQLSEVSGTGLADSVQYDYYATGQVKTIARPNGVDTIYNYFDNGWLKDITHANGAMTLASYQYQYYDDGNREQVIENLQNPQMASIPTGVLASENIQPQDTKTDLTGIDSFAAYQPPAPQTNLSTTRAQELSFGRLPLSFIPNVGQFHRNVKFQTNSRGGSVYFTPSQVVLVLADMTIRPEDSSEPRFSVVDNSKIVRIEYKHAENNPIVAGVGLLPGVANFMIDTRRESWMANTPTYRGIVYRDLYPGIDLQYEGTPEQDLKSTFIVDPGADPSRIQWKYKRADVTLDTDGSLRITLPADTEDQTEITLVEHAPVAWQEQDGQRVAVDVQYVVARNGDIRFAFPQGYDPSLPLIIDPTLTYSTYLGQAGTDVGTAITTDSDGNAYIMGYSMCGAFPTVDPLQAGGAGGNDIIISKISADGSTLLYSTCLGGSAHDYGSSITLDSQGRIVVGAVTQSVNFPIVSGISTYSDSTCSPEMLCQDMVILILNSDGSAIDYSTYLGGTGREELGGLALDGDGNIIVVGSSASSNFPTANAYDNTFGGGTCTVSSPCYDVTVTKIDPDLPGSSAILYSTYLGGSGRDKAYGLTLDSAGRIYLTGYSDADGYPTRNALQPLRAGNQDVILSEVDPSLTGDASLIYSTYLGTNGIDSGWALARDSEGNLYLTGRTVSPRFPLRDPLQYLSHSGICATNCYEAFVTKLNIATNTLVYSTYLGGSHHDEGTGIDVDPSGRAYVVGYTRSDDFPTYDSIQSARGGDACSSVPCMDAFLSVIEPDGQSLAYSTYLGGSRDDDATAVALDSANNVYVIGKSYSTDFPTTLDAYDRINTETNRSDVFIVKVDALGAPPEQTVIHLDIPIMVGSDDAEEQASNGVMSLTNTLLDIVNDKNGVLQQVGLRFTDVNIPTGAVIQNAEIQFTTAENDSAATSLSIRAEASDNAGTFTSAAHNISSRPTTSASVPWNSIPSWTEDHSGPDQRTPNLASVVQEVVDRPGWASGNALAIIISGSGRRAAKSFEHAHQYGVPYLHIEYTMPTTGELGLQITPNPTSFIGAGQNISYTYTLTNLGTVPLSGPYTVSDDRVASVDCSAAQSPLAVGGSTTCVGSYTTVTGDVTTGSVTNSATATASDGTQTVTSNAATVTVNYQAPPAGPITINYIYDPLNRLTNANYSTDDYYHYTYDAVGNRKTQETMLGELLINSSYDYDESNRLIYVNNLEYVWDDNGNLTDYGANHYEYDAANRLKSYSNETAEISYAYNGLNDRLQETVDGNTTTFTMDLNTGLTQALSDGTNHYIYGVDRIAQVNSASEYFLGDALGSVRQLTDQSGEITYASAYDPYGVTTQSYGTSQSAYGYTGEFTSNDLVYLRARMYAPSMGRFLTRDTWSGDYNRPLSLNRWMYTEANPVNLTDPTGHYPSDCLEADDPAQCLRDWVAEGKDDCGEATTPYSPLFCEQLADPKSRRACQTYLALRGNSGWWNGHQPGNLSPQAFAGLLLRMEFNSIGGFADVKESIQQETVVRNFYAHCYAWENCQGDSRSAYDMFAFVGEKKLLEIPERVSLQLNPTDTGTTIAAKWQFRPHWGTTNFESAFLNPPGTWRAGDTQAGIGFREWVPDIRSPSGQSFVYTAPIDWGNISMYGHYNEAVRLLRPENWNSAEGLAEWQFYIRRGGGNTATIVTLSQRKYWNRP